MLLLLILQIKLGEEDYVQFGAVDDDTEMYS